MKAADNKHIKLRVIIVGVLFSLFFATIGAKAVYLQIFCGPRLSQKAANQYEKSFKSSGKRGAIYDTNLTEMAVSVDVTSIAAHPEQMVDIPSTTKTIANLLKMDRGSLLRKLSSDRKFVWIKRHVAPKEARAVRDLDCAGLAFITEHKRFYPNKTLAAPLLGFTNVDDNGLEGLEFYYDNYLKGASTYITVLIDALGRGFNAEETQVPNYNGCNLILTIDRTIQYIVEKTLEETITKFSAKSGIAIVMAPKTGALLAMTQYPFFNPNTFSDFNRELWRNRSITDPFEPGSTMKIFSAAAALESGTSSLNSIYYCENGTYRIGKDIIHDTHPYEWLTLEQIVKLSSNIGAVKVTEITGPERLYKTLQDFGFGAKTGIDCPGESAGSLAPYKRWSKIDAGTIAFGQGISASALQLTSATAAIANDGILMKPFIVQAITDENGRLIQTFGPQKIRRAVSSATARTITQIMRTVTKEGGTGVQAALEGYSACGKTGTAQKIDENGEYAKGKFIASFVGFAPAEKPAVVILVVIDEPRKEHYGGVVAAPAFREIAHKTLNYLNIPPKSKTDRLTAAIDSEA
ncbi:MAG: penicillin-binding protein 2 [Pseudomonadota bacterium]|uniref:Penicillin-binding protein 2 n=1 Tax=Candidatus Desulfatibia profunda TaxID=2841695 RepID=A0A8J6NVY1_9BACT|nr:penicillin-binding protein 2 [Candidatus Desulfatibia profunda]MBL7178707.1 penicillin-binding protein 2 [Desulfobacterales bacterium]MBU0698468.1 penicillin-binding protein 2 [Pseudomonadota bacterium]